MEASSESVEFNITGVDPESAPGLPADSDPVVPDPSDTPTTSAADSEPTNGENVVVVPGGEAPILGGFVEVVEGEHAGQKAAYVLDQEDGTILLLFRDHNYAHQYASVPSSSVRRTLYQGGR